MQTGFAATMSDTESRYISTAENMDYVNYLRSIEDQWPEYTEFRGYLKRNSKRLLRDKRPGFTCSVYMQNVFSDGSRPPPVLLNAGEMGSIHLLDDSLSNAPDGLRSRIILIDLEISKKIVDQRVLDLLRLKFSVDPLFYREFLGSCKISRSRQSEVLYTQYMALKEVQHNSSAFDTISIGKFSPRISSRDLLNNQIAIIAIDREGAPMICSDGIYHNETFLLNLRDNHSLSNEENFCNFCPAGFASSERIRIDQVFASLLQAQHTTSSEEDIFICLVLMARLHLAIGWQYLVGNGKRISNEQHDRKDLIWFRTSIGIIRSDFRQFALYMKKWAKNSAYQAQLEDIRDDQEHLLAEAQELEAALRDIMQLTVSLDSLEESRVSIEEGKRIRLSKSAAS